MAERIALINNQRGIHLRPSCVISAEIQKSGCRIDLARGTGGRMTRVSIPADILSLALLPGDRIRIRVTDEDAQKAERVCDQIAELFAKKFDFT